MRAKEYDDYVAAKDEMTKAIAALEKAVDTMAKGTEGSFLHMTKGLKKAMKVGLSLPITCRFRFSCTYSN